MEGKWPSGVRLNGKEEGERVKEWICSNDAYDKLLACGAITVGELRCQVLKETGFTCSAGIARNKMLAKLASAMNKPAQQTVVLFSAVPQTRPSQDSEARQHEVNEEDNTRG